MYVTINVCECTNNTPIMLTFTMQNSTKLTLGKKGKKATDEDEFCGWTESDKQAALVTLNLVLQQPLSKLWDPPLAEDNFVS